MTSSGFIGLDPELVNQMATRFDNEAGTINNLICQMNNVISSNIPTNWKGTDATTFESDWNTDLVPKLRAVETALRNAASTARNNVTKQQSTSAVL